MKNELTIIYIYSTSLRQTNMQVKEGKKLEAEEDPYYSPAKKESEIYVQLRQQGIQMIRHRDIG